MNDTDPTETQTLAQLLVDLAELHMRTHASPLPKHPAAFGWQATAGSMAAGFARALHALMEVAPEKAAEVAEWFDGPLGEGPDPLEHTDWTERHIAKSPQVLERWSLEARAEAARALEATEDWEKTEKEQQVETEAIHTHFGLSYANYLVLPRTLLQSMPDAWQTEFVALLDQLAEAFAHVPQAEAYKVEAATQHIINEMTESQLAQAGIEADWYGGETPPKELTGVELDEWRAQYEQDAPEYYRDGEELDPHSRVMLPAPDPVPHYNRGRTRIEPRLHRCGNCEGVDPGSCLMNPEQSA